MHRAGADFVMSYASLGAGTIFNYLKRSDVLVLAEGLNVSKVNVPTALVGRTLAKQNPLKESGCHLIGLGHGGRIEMDPDLNKPLASDASMVFVGSLENERRFLGRYASA
jgi:hypothetical protein